MDIRLDVTERYLGIPVRTAGMEEQDLRTLELFCRGERIMEFRVPVHDGKAIDYYGYLNVSGYAGETVTVSGDFPEPFFSAIRLSGADDNAAVIRPELHFTAKRGWINDPNGLVYRPAPSGEEQGPVWHLYFQHNPMNTEWENMSWGHSVSRDLIHWTYCDTVLYPDEHGTVYSGCGLVNDRGLLGLPKEALLFYYTAAAGHNAWSEGKTFKQRLAYSLDGGKTLIRHLSWSLPNLAFENRDPKIFYYTPPDGGEGHYVMLLFLDGNDFAIFCSTDLEHWEQTQTFTLPRAWECPDLFKLPADDGTEHWVFWSADGFYFLGDFDGKQFTVQGELQEAYGTKLPYAAQTYFGTESRTVSVAWLRTRHEGFPYTGAMALPRELSLAAAPDGENSGHPYLLRLSLAREADRIWEPFSDCGISDCGTGDCGIKTGCARWQPDGRPYCLRIRWDGPAEEGAAEGTTERLSLAGQTWLIDRSAGKITHDQETCVSPGGEPITGMTVIADRGIIEISANHDIIYLVYETTDYQLSGEVLLEGAGLRMEAASVKREELSKA